MRWRTLNGERTLLTAAVAAVVLFALWLVASRGPGAEAAQWRLDPTVTPRPDSTEIAVLVQEATCASGSLATDRIEIDVSYTSSAVVIDISVRPLDGAHTCQGIETPYTVRLREPLGDRELLDANARTP